MSPKSFFFATLVYLLPFAPLFTAQKQVVLRATSFSESTSSATSGTAASIGMATLIATNQNCTQKNPTRWQTEKKREHAMKYTAARYLKAVHKELYDLLDPLPNELLKLITGYLTYKKYIFAGGTCSYDFYPQPSRHTIDKLIALGSHCFACTQGNVIKIFKENDNRWKCSQKLKEHTAQIFALAFLEKSGELISGSCDETIKIWTQEPNGSFRARAKETLDEEDANGHSDDVNALQVLPNGQFVSGSSDGTVKVWHRDSKSGRWECAQTLCGYSKGFTVEHLALLKGGELASSAQKSLRDIVIVGTEIKIWNLKSGSCLCTAIFYEGPLRGLIPAPDGGLFCGGSSTVTWWQLGEQSSEKTLSMKRTICDVAGALSGCESELSSFLILPNGHLLLFVEGGFMVTISPREKLLFDEYEFYPEGAQDKARTWEHIHVGQDIWDTPVDDEENLLERPDTSLRRFAGHANIPFDTQRDSHVPTCCLLPNGRVVSGSNQGTLRLWN